MIRIIEDPDNRGSDNRGFTVPEQHPYLFRTTPVALPILYYAAAVPIRNEAGAKRTECKRLTYMRTYFRGISLLL